ncbi:hypothetical protein MC7420_4257 [Coleofasciculus chthonoplastes PCC 7420]|uniref:DUF3598 domain-containing protein n=2 Tax=Coleofasciculus chthonoplastes TaxID=64178 RepID=B4W3Z3_9CYAN|nr:hypothetical protein MC7420_4257 [Coleofasciculus chthonoplastes PCC 7420]
MNNGDRIEKEGLSQTTPSEAKIFQQWHRFIADHGFVWKGILSRYDGKGRLTEVLNSTRKFTPASDASEIEHYLCFINRDDPEKVMEKRWMIEKCGPGIIHPVDPDSTIMFSSQSSGIMSRPGREYAEIYLIEGNRRVSTVISYYPDSYEEINKRCGLANISLFREVKQEESSFPWSEEKLEITNREYPSVQVINSSMLRFGTFDEIPVSNESVDWFAEERLIFDFPDGVSLNIPKTLKSVDKNNLILSWKYSHNQIKRAIAQFSDDTRGADLITLECVIV